MDALVLLGEDMVHVHCFAFGDEDGEAHARSGGKVSISVLLIVGKEIEQLLSVDCHFVVQQGIWWTLEMRSGHQTLEATSATN